MKREPRLRQHQEQTSEAVQVTKPQTEFGSVEEMLRHDSAQVSPPPIIEERLKKSIGNEPKPSRSWWQRVFKPEP